MPRNRRIQRKARKTDQLLRDRKRETEMEGFLLLRKRETVKRRYERGLENL